MTGRIRHLDQVLPRQRRNPHPVVGVVAVLALIAAGSLVGHRNDIERAVPPMHNPDPAVIGPSRAG